jgi:hypothetical protein
VVSGEPAIHSVTGSSTVSHSVIQSSITHSLSYLFLDALIHLSIPLPPCFSDGQRDRRPSRTSGVVLRPRQGRHNHDTLVSTSSGRPWGPASSVLRAGHKAASLCPSVPGAPKGPAALGGRWGQSGIDLRSFFSLRVSRGGPGGRLGFYEGDLHGYFRSGERSQAQTPDTTGHPLPLGQTGTRTETPLAEQTWPVVATAL